jgi:hypothetical protein
VTYRSNRRPGRVGDLPPRGIEWWPKLPFDNPQCQNMCLEPRAEIPSHRDVMRLDIFRNSCFESSGDGRKEKKGPQTFFLTKLTPLIIASRMPRRARIAPGGVVYHTLNRAQALRRCVNRGTPYGWANWTNRGYARIEIHTSVSRQT